LLNFRLLRRFIGCLLVFLLKEVALLDCGLRLLRRSALGPATRDEQGGTHSNQNFVHHLNSL
jgi:hypothetical protein